MDRPVLWFCLGMAQMFAAVVAFVLLMTTGVNAISVAAAAAATALTLVSRRLFRSKTKTARPR